MGYLTKSKRFENNEFTINIGEEDFTFSLESIENNIRLDERSSMLFKRAIEINSDITLDNNIIKAGYYEVNIKDEKEKWLKAIEELQNQKLIETKDNKTYTITKKGKEYYKNNLM